MEIISHVLVYPTRHQFPCYVGQTYIKVPEREIQQFVLGAHIVA